MARRLPLALTAASGFAGLGWQIVWTQQGALWLGHEAASVLAVVAAFFGGLGVGALVLSPRIGRSARPLRWVAACEMAIAAWGGVLLVLMAPFSQAALALIGPQPAPAWQWAVAFCGTFVLLLPATAAMGATLPALARAGLQPGDSGGGFAALLAANTAGAVCGVLATAFWCVPEWGLQRTAALCIGLNLLCALAALALAARAAPVVAGAAAASAGPGRSRLLARLAATGLLGIGFEVLVVRVLSQVTEDTVYTFALLLAVYLVGSALGSAAYARWGAGSSDAEAVADRLLWALAAVCGLSAAGLWGAEHLKAAWLTVAGPGLAPALAAEAGLALAAFALPTVVMGALFSHLCAQAASRGIGVGSALGANTLGAAAAPWLFGVLLAPWLGPGRALLVLAGAYLLLGSPRARQRLASWALGGALAAAAAWAPPLAFVEVPEGGRILSYRDGVTAAVSVVEDAEGVARLRIDNRQQEGSSATRFVDARQAVLPLLLHPAPRRALFLGLGTGVTAAAAAADPTLEVDAVELLPEVIEASSHFRTGALPDHLHLRAADARRWVRSTTVRYDLIVADNFHPARSGSGALYTVEHFRAVAARLAAGGVFCQWLPLHQLDLDTLRSIVRSFLAVYPQATALLASNSLRTPVLGLVGRGPGAGLPDAAALHRRIATAALPGGAAAFGVEDEFALLGSFVAGPAALARWVGQAPLNTDDRPWVAYRAPRITYAPDSTPDERLLTLLHEVSVAPADLLAASGEDAARLAARLFAYWTARNRYLEAGRDVRPAAAVQDMLAQVREPLLAVLRTSPDFRPAYDPLLRMAGALAQSDAGAARALLAELAQAQPARPEAELALKSLGAEARR
jgi:spermidine synthase